MNATSIIPTASQINQTIEPLLEALDASHFSASSEYNSDEDCYDEGAIYSSPLTWCAGIDGTDCTGEWLQVDFGNNTKYVFSIGTKGNQWDEWIKRYKIRYSTNGTSWIYYTNNDTVELFTGNRDAENEKLNTFSTPFIAKKVRIYPKTANKHCSLKWELYGYEYIPIIITTTMENSTTTRTTHRGPAKRPTKRPTTQVIKTTLDNENTKDLTRANAVVAAILLFAVALPFILFVLYKHKITMENQKEFRDALRQLVDGVQSSSANQGEGERRSTMAEAVEPKHTAGEQMNNTEMGGEQAVAPASESSEKAAAEHEDPPVANISDGSTSCSDVDSLFEAVEPGLSSKHPIDDIAEIVILPPAPSVHIPNTKDVTEGDMDGAHDEYDALVCWLLEHKLGSLLKNEAFMDQVSTINDILLLNESELVYFMEECDFRLLEKKKFLKTVNELNNKEIDPQTRNDNNPGHQSSISADDATPNSANGLLNKHKQSSSQINIVIKDADVGGAFPYNEVDVASDSDSLDEDRLNAMTSISVQQVYNMDNEDANDLDVKDLPSSTDEDDDDNDGLQKPPLQEADCQAIQLNDARVRMHAYTARKVKHDESKILEPEPKIKIHLYSPRRVKSDDDDGESEMVQVNQPEAQDINAIPLKDDDADPHLQQAESEMLQIDEDVPNVEEDDHKSSELRTDVTGELDGL